MEFRMDGRIALITGGSDGLGKATAHCFAESGAQVALIARTLSKLDSAKEEVALASGQTVKAYQCDVRDGLQIAETFSEILADFGHIDILVNNAGVSQIANFLEITDEVWQSDIDLKLMAAVRLSRLALPGMQERSWGRIINVLNVGAKAPWGGSAPTTITRAAGMALTKVLAHEGAPYNVLSNALLVGFIESGQWVRRRDHLAAGTPMDSFLSEMAKEQKIPLGRLGTAEEFAKLAGFLASDGGSYITGTAINVDGGVCPVL